MFKILTQPYPFPQNSIATKMLFCLGEGLFIAFFLIAFQPFGSAEWQHPNKTMLLLGYGLVTMVAGLILRVLLPKIFPRFFVENNWVVWREIAMVMLLLFLITAGNSLYSNSLGIVQLSLESFIYMFSIVMLLGIFPAVIWVLTTYIYKLKKYSQPITISPQKPLENHDLPIIFVAENEKDTLKILPQHLLYIESSDNYSTIVFEKDQKIQKELLRSSLSRLETQINTPQIARCHRSFIVNLNRVSRVSGNAQGYKFHLDSEPELVVAVARKYASLVKELQ